MNYTVTIITDNGWSETSNPIAIGVTRAVANSIRRHFEKVLKYNDYTQTGQYCTVINRDYVINHSDFE